MEAGLLALAYLVVTTQLEEGPPPLQCAFGKQAAEMCPDRSTRLLSLQSYLLQGEIIWEEKLAYFLHSLTLLRYKQYQR